MLRSKVLGIGSYVPERVVTNDEIPYLNERHERCETIQTHTSHRWIVERTGIEARHYAPNDGSTATSDLAVRAAERALKDSAIHKTEVDCLILATLSPDIHFPGTAVFVQNKLGLTNHPACYDIRQQCSGFIYGMQMADAFIRSGLYRCILLIGAELHSHALEYNDRGRDVMVLFGDGAGAAVLVPEESADPRAGVLTTHVYADGAGAWDLHLKLFEIKEAPFVNYDPHNPEENIKRFPQMNGRKVFTNAVRRMGEVCQEALTATGLTWKDIDWFVPHQANLRITQKLAERAHIPSEKVLNSIQYYGNTTAASIPLTLDHHYQKGTVTKGDLILAAVFGAGYTWGATIFRFG